MVLINLNTGAVMQVEPEMNAGRLVMLNLSDCAKSLQEPPTSVFLMPYLRQRMTGKNATSEALSGARSLEGYSMSDCVEADRNGIHLAPMFPHDPDDISWAF